MKKALLAILFPLAAFRPAQAERLPKNLGPAEFYRPPQLTLMVGFIKDPQHKNFTLEQWAKGIGKNFDAKQLVARAKQAGVVQIIWYDKWIDGLVFRKTKTTSFVTWRDFLAELAPECKRHGIKLVPYFNTFYDGNPEFAQWAAVDQRGRPIPFSPFWPLNLLSMHSPFREKALEQIRELLIDYGVDGIWLDVPNYASISYDKWSQDAFRKKYGKPVEDASSAERREFAIDSTVNWNKEVAAFVRKIKPSAVVTTNGLYEALVSGPRHSAGMAEPVDYFSHELHTADGQQRIAPILGGFNKPAEGGTLISDDWFTPLNSGPLKSSKSSNQVHLEMAALFSSGLNVYLALALAHDGTAHEATLQLMDLAGDWLRKRRPYLEGAENYCDVGIALGTANPAEAWWPGGKDDYSAGLAPIEEHLRKSGYLPCRLLNNPHSQTWEEMPREMRAVIIPDRVSFTAADAARVRAFARSGGKVLAFGRGAALGVTGEPSRAEAMFGVRSLGYLEPASRGGLEIELVNKNVPVTPPILHLQPSPATTVLWAVTGVEGAMPALTRNPVEKGVAYLAAVPEGSLAKSPEVLERVWREVIGEPLWKVDDTSGRYVARLRQQGRRIVLHVMDTLSVTEGPMQRYRPAYTKLHINAQAVPFRRATVVPDNRSLETTSTNTWISFEVYPDPELTIVLE
jgi:hypothetical protein